MKKLSSFIRMRALPLLLALICVVSLIPSYARAAEETIKLDSVGYSGVRYQSEALGSCSLHQMFFDDGGKITTGFCGTKGGGMGSSLIGQTWTRATEITDPTVKMMVAYYYSHATNTFPDKAVSLGVNETWDANYTWYYNAWVQAIIWRYQAGTLEDPVEDCAEELLYVLNALRGWNKQSIDDDYDGASYRARTQYIMDLGAQGCWGDSKVYLYNFTGAGSSEHVASSVQSIVLGDLIVDTPRETYSLTVKKTDATNPNKGLSGAKFHISSANGAFTKDIVTGADGTYTLTGLSANTYAITETGAPDGYQIDNAGPQYAVLPGNGSNTVTVTFTDSRAPAEPGQSQTGEGKIRKVDADNPTMGLAGATIKIEGVDNSFTGTYVTAEGGYLTDVPWDSMPHGSYTATEVTPPEGYTMSPDSSKTKQTFVWDGTTDVALVFENDARVKIKLIKQDDSGSPLPGAVFNVIKDGQVIASEATNAAGEIIVPNVTEGLYAFAEVSAPEGKARLEHTVFAYVDQATIDGGGTVTVTAVDRDLPTLTITKRDKQDQSPIGGTVFEVKGVHSGFHQDVTVGPDGTATLTAIPVDYYDVTEKAVPEPYVISDEPTQTIWLGPGDDGELIFNNLQKPKLTLLKRDADDPSVTLPQTVFTVEGFDNDYKDDWTTGADGTVTKYLEPGTYKITEKSVPSPYLLDWEGVERSLRAGEEYTVVAEDHKAPSIEIIKTDSITGDFLPNVRFQVWYASNDTETGEYNDLGVFTTDENGRIVLTEPQIQMRDGWFRVKELEPPRGYSIKDSDTQEAFVPAGKSHTFYFQNTPLSAIVVWKFDDVTGEAVSNCTFRVSYLGGDTSGTGGTVIGTYTTSANGSFTVTGLKAGYYIIEEIASDADHVISCPPQTVYISGKDQDIVQLFFGNTPKGNILVKKVSAKDGSPLSDVEFLVTEADGTLVGDANGKFVTDSSGSFTIEGLDPGTTLVIKEARAKPGYLLDDAPQTVVVKPGRTVTLEYRNQPTGGLIVHKLSSKDKSPLEGVQFKITYADGRVVDAEGGQLSSNGLYWTNAEGQIVLDGITAR